jgi:hypothetical protein
MSRLLLDITKRPLSFCFGELAELVSSTQHWKLLVSLQSPEAFSRFLHGVRGRTLPLFAFFPCYFGIASLLMGDASSY